MVDKTIPELPSGGALQPNDLIPISRGSGNFKIPGSSFVTSLPFTGAKFVDGTLGSDTIGNGDFNAPYATIQKAHDEALVGSVIWVAEGSYAQDLNWTKSVSIKSIGAVEINGAGVINLPSTNLPFLFQGISFLSSAASPLSVTGVGALIGYFENCEISSLDSGGTSCVTFINDDSASSLTFRNTKFTLANGAPNNGWVQANNAANVYFENCTATITTGISSIGFQRLGTGKFNAVNCQFEGSGYFAGQISANLFNCRIEGNLADFPFVVGSGSSGFINSSNTIWGSGASLGSKILNAGGVTFTSSNDLIYGGLYNQDDSSAFLNNTVLKTFGIDPITVSSAVNKTVLTNCEINAQSAEFIATGTGLFSASGLTLTGEVASFGASLNDGEGYKGNPVCSVVLADQVLPSVIQNGSLVYYNNHLYIGKGGTYSQLDDQAAGARSAGQLFVATDGSDITGTGSIGNPYASIGAAMAVSDPGFQIVVWPGIYTEDFNLGFGASILGLGLVTVVGNVTSNNGGDSPEIQTLANITIAPTSGSPLTISGSGTKKLHLINSTLAGNGAPSFIFSNTSDQSELIIRGGEVTLDNSTGVPLASVSMAGKCRLDDVSARILDNPNVQSFYVNGSGLLEIANNSKIDGSITNVGSTNINIYSGVTLAASAGAGTPLAAIDHIGGGIINLFSGVIVGAYCASDSFTGSGIMNDYGTLFLNGNGLFSSDLNGGNGVTPIPTSALQLTAKVKKVTGGYTFLPSDCTVVYEGSTEGDIINLLGATQSQNRIFNVVNNSAATIYVDGEIEPNSRVALLPQESASFQTIDGGTIKRLAWNDSKIQNVLFVATNGSDSGLGNITSPFETIGAALTVAGTTSRTLILIAPGIYTENLVIPDSVQLKSFAGFVSNLVTTEAVIVGNTTFASGIQAVFEGIKFSSPAGATFSISSGCDLYFKDCYAENTGTEDVMSIDTANAVNITLKSTEFRVSDSLTSGAMAIRTSSDCTTIFDISGDSILKNADSNTTTALQLYGNCICNFNGGEIHGVTVTGDLGIFNGDKGLELHNDSGPSLFVVSTVASSYLGDVKRIGGSSTDFIVTGTGNITASTINIGKNDSGIKPFDTDNLNSVTIQPTYAFLPAPPYVAGVNYDGIEAGSAVARTSGFGSNIATLTLKAGRTYEISIAGGFRGDAATTVSRLTLAFSTTSNSWSDLNGRFNTVVLTAGTLPFAAGSSARYTLNVGPTRFTVPGTLGDDVPVYLVARADFAIGACSAFGTITANEIGA